VAGIVCIGSYSAGHQLVITEDQVLQLYDTVQGRQGVSEAFITHEKFAKFNPYTAEIEALLKREPVSRQSMRVKQPAGFFSARFYRAITVGECSCS
jgi:hypothetical protein